MWETIRGYLTFTRKERFGVLFLLIIISVLFVLPYFFKASPGEPEPAAYEKMKTEIQKFEQRAMDSSHIQGNSYHYSKSKTDDPPTVPLNGAESFHATMFYFDPNKIQAEDWRRLGLSERLSQTILRYVQKGGHFHKAEDLKKLYGLKISDYDRLSPFVRITSSASGFKMGTHYDTVYAKHIPSTEKRDSFYHETRWKTETHQSLSAKTFSSTDINLADSAAWTRFPGIGEKLASRIIHFREKLGGFYRTDQVGETFGLPDSTFQKIKPFLVIGSVLLNRIDLNSATKEALQSHPYIRWQIAKSILDYRLQHGAFQSVDALLQIASMDSAKFERLKPYLIVP
jgi:competence protein ComEA